jgi:hypothetical protein
MSTSGAGFGVSGLLQGFAQSYTQARIRATQMEVAQRNGLASTLMQLYPNARPEAQADIGQRLLTIYLTPPGKKLDKKIGDVMSIGQAGAQAGMAAGQASAQQVAGAGQSAQAAATPAQAPGLTTPPPDATFAGTGGAPPAAPGTTPGAAQPAGLPLTQAPKIPPPPDLSQPGSGYSPLLSPAEKNAQLAATIGAQQDATISSAIAARDRYIQAHPDADPTEVSMALGHTLPMWAMKTQVTEKGVLGSDLLKSNPDIRTQSGQPIDPKGRYDLGSIGNSKFALPTGIATENTQSQIANRTGTLAEKVSEFKTTDAYRKWKAEFDTQNRLKIAQMHIDATTNKAPAAMMQTAVFARGGLDRLQDAQTEMSKLESSGVMGSLPANKVEDWIFGKGLVDPSLPADVRQSIGKMRAALGYTSSAAMRAHTGRTSHEIYEDFKARLGANQDWSALRGAIDETQGMLGDYAQSASDKNIRAIRGGNNLPPPPSSGTVNMKAPNGQVKPVPADQVEHFKSLGATVVP